MKKQSNKTYTILLIFSAILFSTAIYFMSSSLILGASAGGSVSAPVTTIESEDVVPETTPSAAVAEPKEATTATSAVVENNVREAPKEVYVVKEGQTLWEIAQDSGLSIQTLMNQNQLSSSVIVEGQELVFN